MRGATTSPRPSSARRAASALLTALALLALAPGDALAVPRSKAKAAKGAKPGKSVQKHRAKARKVSPAHQKLKEAIEQDAGAGEDAGEGKLGAASFYGLGFQGRRSASGERFDARNLTAASNHYPLGSWVAVRRLDTERCVVVKVNDRMHAAHRTRIIDLSRSAAEKLAMISAGVVLVRVARLEGKPEGDQAPVCAQAFAKVKVYECRTCVSADLLREGQTPALPSIPAETDVPPDVAAGHQD